MSAGCQLRFYTWFGNNIFTLVGIFHYYASSISNEAVNLTTTYNIKRKPTEKKELGNALRALD